MTTFELPRHLEGLPALERGQVPLFG